MIIPIAARTMVQQIVGEMRQQAQPHSQPSARQVQGRDKVTAEGIVSREQRLEIP